MGYLLIFAPFGYAQGKPFDYAQGVKIQHQQAAPFDYDSAPECNQSYWIQKILLPLHFQTSLHDLQNQTKNQNFNKSVTLSPFLISLGRKTNGL